MPRGTRNRPATESSPAPTPEPRLPPPKKARKPSKRAEDTAATARLLEEHRIERERQKIADEVRHAERGAHHHSTAEGRRLRLEYSESLRRKGDVAERVRAQKEKEEKEWKDEVARYGEDEARRRREEDRAFMKEQAMLLTSELEDLQFEEKSANPDIIIGTLIRVNKSLFLQDTLAAVKLDDFEIADYETRLVGEIVRREETDICPAFNSEWVREKTVAHIKGRHARSTRTHQTLTDFSMEEWDKVVPIIKDQSARWDTVIDVKIEITYNAPKAKKEKGSKRAIEVLDSDGVSEATPRPNKTTRTDKLTEKAKDRDQKLSGARANELAVLQRW